MNTYFSNCTTTAEAKTRYRELVRQHHPDIGGDTKTMQEINFQYSKFLAEFAHTEARNRQHQAHAENRKSAADYHDLNEVSEDLRVMIEFALNLEGVEVELMGLWVWLTGNTKAHKDTLKEWNKTHEARRWKWSPKKEAWYFAGVPSFGRNDSTLDEIRSTYGSTRYTRDDDKRTQVAGVLPA